MEQTTKQFNFIAKPLSLLLGVTILFLVTFFVGIKQITKINKDIKDSQKLEIRLQNKISVLKVVETNLFDDTTLVDIALPSNNAVLFAINQIKVMSSRNNVAVSNIGTSKTINLNPTIVKNPIYFEVDGSMDDIHRLLQSFTSVLPIMTLDSVRVDPSRSPTLISVTMNVFSTELPKTIPSVSSSVNELTESEVTLLNQISKYSLPQFTDPKPSQNSETKEDPFK